MSQIATQSAGKRHVVLPRCLAFEIGTPVRVKFARGPDQSRYLPNNDGTPLTLRRRPSSLTLAALRNAFVLRNGGSPCPHRTLN
jgi:hypothetical protein